ncbi:hypothetical protein P171DRAFT_433313 [Karstenula rhodostoma CBS 690.94]|uniref:Uncharacterized protein n=1 Tax=Karstenula rhodostoma CBS 690.94 TaxID=1392251 RepID=A0A9P4U921_9PLEO|nr:hypothetical protein P171DRAFT_433313 [Karstenula rhodostoma CBS 690.94]
MLRRDPALWSRSPIRRSTRSALLPSRCFSKTSLASARHNDEQNNNNAKKPEGVSDLEWLRQRHLRRWRKRIEEDPYGALFGASEEMLKGRGLESYIEKQREMHRKGLEWVQKAFPKWMLEDMGLRDGDKSTGGDRYPNNVKIETREDGGAKERERAFRKPWYKDRKVERDTGNEGVKSPSDSRWPREQRLSSFQSPGALHEDRVQGLRKDRRPLEDPVAQEQTSAKTLDTANASAPERTPTPIPGKNMQSTKDATARETSFIEEFLAERTSAAPPHSSEPGNNKDWRQTALERRAARSPILEPRRKTDVPVVDVTAKDKGRNGNGPGVEREARPPVKSNNEPGSTSNRAVIDFNGTSSSRMGRKEVEEFESRVEETSDSAKQQESLDNVPETSTESGCMHRSRFSPYPWIKTDDWVLPPSKNAAEELDEYADVKLSSLNTDDIRFSHTGPGTSSNPRKSTSDVLKQLPEDDLDFLTADDVRASMGRTKGNREDNKAAVRQKLEEEYGKDTPEIDPLLEAQVVNGQYVRRKTSEMTLAQEQTKSTESGTNTIVSEQKIENTTSKPVSVLETSLDFMSRWLHNGGNVLAQHFWQDPVQLVAGQLSGAEEQFLKGIGVGVLKGRRAFASIKDELVEDIPAAKELVDRLNRDDIKASAGAVRLYRDLPSALKDTSDADASKAAAHKRIRKLRQELLDTDKQYKKACEAVDGMKNATKPSFLQRKRLRYASEVLRKNAKLTRMAIFGLQGRIEVEAGSSSGLVARELLHRLLTLQDTQLALSRLVSRAIQVLGINLEAEEEVSTKSDESTVDLSDPSIVEALASAAAKDTPARQTMDAAAANAKLEDEVSKQKAAMRGLSDDGYKHPPKPFVRKSFDGPNPLAHSLFRPFGLQLDSLGKDADAAQNDVVSAAEKEKGDRLLVKEVKKAYEDTYGAITVDHWQVPPAETPPPTIEGVAEVPDTETVKRQPSIQMLKEDEVSPTITGEALATATDSASVPMSNVAVGEGAAEVRAVSKKDDVNHGSVESEDSTQPAHRELLEPLETIGPEQHITSADTKETNTNPTPSTNPENEYSYDTATDTYVPISYKTLIYNAETDKLSITTSQVPQPNPPITPIPLHEALATLFHPAKFVDHLPESFHVIQAKPDVLSVRTASPFNATAEKNITTTVDRPGVKKADAEEAEGWKGINPVDGTTTLSPTGFVSVGSDLDRDFAERRRKADEYHREVKKSKKNMEAPERKKKGKVGVGGVVKAAIWAGALCYVVGVAAEVAKVPF